MRYVIVLSGDIRDDEAARAWLTGSDRVICVDGGARHLHRLGYAPDLLIGDLDSISPDDLAWISEKRIPIMRYPVEKDATDAELALTYAAGCLPDLRRDHELVVLAALGSRPDHVLANQMLAAGLAGQGWRLILTDGVSRVYTLAGGQTLHLSLPAPAAGLKWSLSAIPITAVAAGLTYQDGLAYPLQRATLTLGSSRGVSNSFTGVPEVEISLEEGVILLIATPEQ
ncbi:MAG: thiamine diphosphokinase [Clostridiaceae bacterium]|nr:thiamine diphosphokinase [Clostridiaceae bacterium]